MFKIISAGDAPKGTKFFSASQIKQWKACKVCWAAKYLDGIEQAQNFAAQRGIDIHRILEKYLAVGDPIDPSKKYGKMALAGIQYLPTPGSCEVEHKFSFSYDDVYFRGGIDFFYKNENGIYVIGDHKTTSGFKNMMTEMAIKHDTQAALYAFYIMNKFAVTETELKWIYYITQGSPQSKLLSCKLNLTEATETVKLVIQDCKEMLNAIAENKTATDFDPPPNGCKSYGECLAKVVGTRLMRNPNMSNEKRSLKDFLDKRAVAVTGEEKKEEIAVEQGLPFITDPETNPAQQEDIPEVIEQKPIHEEKIGWTLLVDCLPQKGSEKVVELGDVLKPVFKMIAKDYNVGHHSFIPYEARGAFVTRLDKHLTENPVADGTIVLMSMSSPDARDAFDVLVNHATRVYRSAR